MLDQINRLSESIGEPPISIIQNAIDLYEKKFSKKNPQTLTAKERKLLADIMQKVGKTYSSTLTKEQLSNRARAGGVKRRNSLTDDQRRDIATKAAKTRWSKKESSE